MDKAKKITNIFLWTFLASSVVLICIMWFTLNDRGYTYSYNGTEIVKHSWHEVVRFLMWLCMVVVMLSAGSFTVLKIIKFVKEKNKIISGIISILGIWLVVIVVVFQSYALLWLRFEGNDTVGFYEFSNGDNTIVIEEYATSLFGPYCCRVYQVHGNMKADYIGHLGRADRGENEGEFDVKWYEGYVEITYDPCQPDKQLETESIKLK